MQLTQLNIKNFRGIEELSFSLDNICVLIGENNAGKSTILDAIRICLTRTLTRRGAVFDEYDYYLPNATSEPSTSPPIEITLRFAERQENEWADEISQLLGPAEQVDMNDLRSVTLQVTSGFDSAIGDYATDYNFLNLVGAPLTTAKLPRYLTNLRQLVPAFYLASLRDAAQEFRARSPFWGPFVRSLDIDEDARKELEAALLELNRKVLEKHAAFNTVKDRLRQTADLLPLGNADPVSIDAVPSKVFDILSRTQVNLASKTGAQIPIVRHGSGTQSFAVICLFDAFLRSQIVEGYGDHAEPLLALEEPEAHLHPSAIKAVGQMLQSLSGQKLLSTHSGDLLAGVPLDKIRRLRRTNGKISVHQVEKGVLTQDEANKLDYQIRSTRGSLLFSRCWLLVEGETEALLVVECARAMTYDLYVDGVSCIEFAQVGVEKFIKLADQLGIEWVVLADNDDAGESYKRSAQAQLNGRTENDHIRLLDHGTMEVFLCMEGYGEIYEDSVSDQKRASVTADQGTIDYWKQVVGAQQKNSKPKNALVVSERIVRIGKNAVPKLLQEVIEQSRDLARRAS